MLDFKKNINNKITEFENKLSELNDKLNQKDSLKSTEMIDTIANEAMDRIHRAKNILIRGVLEHMGDIQSKKDHDLNKVKSVLNVVGCQENHLAFYRVGKPKPNQRFPRMLKVVMSSEYQAVDPKNSFSEESSGIK